MLPAANTENYAEAEHQLPAATTNQIERRAAPGSYTENGSINLECFLIY
jgi:hypothetical protein